jgi:hypothetical protein
MSVRVVLAGLFMFLHRIYRGPTTPLLGNWRIYNSVICVLCESV